MKNIIIVMLFLFSASAFGLPVKRFFRDLKLATQKLIEYQSFSSPSVAGTTNILLSDAGVTNGTSIFTTSTFVAQPDISRNIVITPGATAADVAACVIVVNGTDIHSDAISENFTFIENQATAVTGNKAFKTVTSVVYPVGCEDSPYSETWNIGYGEKLGMKRCMDQPGHVVMTTVGGVFESTRPTVASTTAIVSNNTIDFNGTMNGSSTFEAFFFQNYNSNCF